MSARTAPASLDELDRRIVNAVQGGFPIVDELCNALIE